MDRIFYGFKNIIMDLEKIMLDALIYFKDQTKTPSQDGFINYVFSQYKGEADDNAFEDVAQFYHMHFE